VSRVIRPYGDTTGDGMVQMSFTLPVANDRRAQGAAAQLARKMGIDHPLVVHEKEIAGGFTFFVIYGSVHHLVDLDDVVVAEREYPLLAAKEADLAIRRLLGRKLVVVGASVGTDAHTVGIDAILSVKGFAGEKGLEYYREMKVINLGSQVDATDLIDRAGDEAADAILVSQVITQRDAHRRHVREVTAALDAGWPGDRPRPLVVVGGPRFDPAEAADLGVDRVFGKGTTPADVASYLVHALAQRSAA
jgi:beta-lysine 5,6-aminomutase beta subunit